MATQTFQPLDASDETLRKLLDNRPILWVGAGMSMAAGYPSTWDLVSAMYEKSVDPIPDGLTFTQTADEFITRNSQGELSDLLNALLAPPHVPTDSHRAIARLAAKDQFAAIITTNYDNLLERVLDDQGQTS